ncbi:MAG: hypothetical protein AAF404_04620 [Pseudomonadota bacterium]
MQTIKHSTQLLQHPARQWVAGVMLAGTMLLQACGSDNNNTTTTGTQGPLVKSVSVFGINIRATAGVEDNLVRHAASILAEYLDNDEDGVPDNQLVIDNMVQRDATLVMARDFAELEAIESQVQATEYWQDLLADETIPNGSVSGEFDASYEEVLHLITHVGYANAYPESFGEQPGSTLANAMDTARGGNFQQVPASYPAGAWYTYDDTTCEYDCQVTEYVYWALTSMLGAQEFTGRLAQIEQEWRPNTRELVQSTDTAVYNLLTMPQFALPTRLPDGTYQAQQFEIQTTVTTDSANYEGGTPLNVIGANSESTCRQSADNDASACFIVNGQTAQMYGVIGNRINTTLSDLLSTQSQVTTIEMMQVPGSMDDEANLLAGRTIYNAGLDTVVRSSSVIASGGVDFFLAGNRRTVEPGAMIGVHSWAAVADDGSLIQGGDLPTDHPQHQLYIQYYTDINLADPAGFYFYTLQAAPAEGIHYMNGEDISRFGLATQ